VPQISYRDLTELLKENGCYLKAQGKGSHEKWYSPITNRCFTVSVNIKAVGTYHHILKEAGIKNHR
jgi:predicted RNA binding protein YcfA (HicA-like mRNA interferase family)